MSAIDVLAELPLLLASGRLSGEEAELRRAAEALASSETGGVSVRDATQARIWLAYVAARSWQPVRIVLSNEGRSRGFPEIAPDLAAMRTWCQKSCRGAWAYEGLTATLRDPRDAALTFWFEDPREARSFMLKWMPLRCT